MTAHATTHHAHDHAQEERRYMVIFVWLGLLTAAEIGVTYLPLSRMAIGALLVIMAATKAALVALYYMHLVNEKRTLTYIAITPMILCVFLILMLLPDLGAITRLLTTAAPAAATGGAAH